MCVLHMQSNAESMFYRATKFSKKKAVRRSEAPIKPSVFFGFCCCCCCCPLDFLCGGHSHTIFMDMFLPNDSLNRSVYREMSEIF